MAKIKSILAVGYSTTMRPNPQDENEPAKAYANLQISGVVSLNQLAAHILDHNSTFSLGTVIGVLTELQHCTRELILQGYKVNLGDLGTFCPSISSTGASSLEKFTVENIKDYKVNFAPGEALSDLRSVVKFKRVAPRYAQDATLAAQIAGEETAVITPDGETSGGDGGGGNG